METIRGQGLPGVRVGTGAADKWMVILKTAFLRSLYTLIDSKYAI